MKLPISKKYIFLAAFAVSIVSILQAYTNAQHNPQQAFSWMHTSFFWLSNYFLWALMIEIIYRSYLIVNNKFAPGIWWFGLHAILLLFFSLFHFVLTSIVISVLVSLATGTGFISYTWKTLTFFPSSIISHLVDYSMIIVILWITELYRNYHEEQNALRDAEKQLKSAQLNALRYQLNPHFLYNTLNTIASFMGNNGKGQEVISTLGNLLRAMLRDDDEQLIPLSQEIDYVKDYLKIEKYRFEDNLEVDYNFDELAMKASVPSLILQPLVENAIKHGFKDVRKVGRIRIEGVSEVSQLYLAVEDNGPGQNQAEVNQSGIGIPNVMERLQKLFPGKSDVKIITSPDSGFRIELSIPLIAA